MSDPTPRRLHDPLLGDPVVTAWFTTEAQVQAMLEVEAALAAAEAEVGVVPVRCVAPIRAAARAELYDCAALAEALARSGAPAVPVARALTARVAAADPDAARYVHWGATSQDITDTALALQLREAVPRVVEHLGRATGAAAALARRFAETPMAGRTWLQQATPVSFGLKAAGWLDGLGRCRRRVSGALDDALVLQLGGATGTLAALGPRGIAVTEVLAARLGLAVADLPWHAYRDRVGALGCALGLATGVAGKVARDVSLLAQSEVAEAWEGGDDDRGGSSTMPHKRNPVGAAVALAAAARMPGLVAALLGTLPQEHERGLGGWQAEWDLVPDLVGVAAGGTRGLADCLERLVVDPERMCANLEASGGLPLSEAVAMTLADRLGRGAAREAVERACRRAVAEHRPLAEVLADDPVVSAEIDGATIARRLDPRHYLGAAQDFIGRALARHEDGD